MAKPPETPPSSDIDGVDEDRQRIDRPENGDPGQIAKLQEERDEAHARPRSSRP